MLGILASAYSSAGVATSDFELIQTVSVGAGGASSITFSSIPGTYKHLQIRGISLHATAGYDQLQFNSDTGTNYSWHQLSGDGTAASSTAGTTVAFMRCGYVQVTTAAYAGATVIDVLDYANTSKNKTIRALFGADANGSGIAGLFSGNWRSTAAITSLLIYPATGNFAQYASFSLYGVK